MANLLKVEPRTKFGKRNNRRLHWAGKLPAVLYGHGEEPVSLTLGADQLEAAVRHGAKVVDLEGAATGQGAVARRAVGHVFPPGAARRFAARDGRRER